MVSNAPLHASESLKAQTVLRVDAHAHLHRCYELGSFVEAAHSNLYAGLPAGESRVGCLMVAGVKGSNPLLRVDSEQDRLPRGWSARVFRDQSQLLQHENGDRIVLVAGRQVRTSERLELLVFGSEVPVVDGKPFATSFSQAVERSQLVIVPWALGKWRFGREASVRSALEEYRANPAAGASVFLGDNANRWRATAPRALPRLSELGFGVLPGSDPIGYPGGFRTVGSFGFDIPVEFDATQPATSLFRALRTGNPIEPFGSAASLAGCVAGQIRVRVSSGAA